MYRIFSEKTSDLHAQDSSSTARDLCGRGIETFPISSYQKEYTDRGHAKTKTLEHPVQIQLEVGQPSKLEHRPKKDVPKVKDNINAINGKLMATGEE